MMLPIRLLVIITLVASQPQFKKHWKRAPVHGAFNVDAYAYNKPQVNLVKQLPAATKPGEMLPVRQVLQHISHSSRALAMPKAQYRNLDDAESKPATDYREGSLVPALKATTLAALNSQLVQLQMNLSQTRSSLYSHEFHVQNMGTRKIVLLNTLAKKEHHRPVSTEVTNIQERPLNVKLALPELIGSVEEHQLQAEITATTPNQVKAEPISYLETEPSNKGQLSDVTTDSKEIARDVSKAPTIAIESTAAVGHKEQLKTIVNGKQQQEQEQEMRNQHQLPMKLKLRVENAADSNHDNIGFSVAPVTESKPVEIDGVKAHRLKSKRKQTKTKVKTQNQNQTQTQRKTSNETDSKLATSSAPVDMLMSETADVSTGNPQQQHKGSRVRVSVMAKGKGKRKGAGQKQEIETTTNWWQILPYAEIRKFLNTIYDSIADDSDDERAAHRI
ncbi:GH22000 [Drosophila grimshawi]|uniref:GH22000 n=2 Tax=Drosophila grimshawi TaxID=7222 RepID=B4J975_DROGR|nr:GH22000 [Drosophila grimshawi]